MTIQIEIDANLMEEEVIIFSSPRLYYSRAREAVNEKQPSGKKQRVSDTFLCIYGIIAAIRMEVSYYVQKNFFL